MIAVLIAVPLTLLLDGDDAAEVAVPPIVLDESNSFHSKRLGVSGSAPTGWSVSKTPSHVVFRTLSGLARVVVAAPGSAGEAGAIFRDAIKSLDIAFASVSRGPTLRLARIDGLPTRSTFLALEREGGIEVQAAIAVAKGNERSYLVEVFVSEGAEPRRFGEAQAIIDGLELSG